MVKTVGVDFFCYHRDRPGSMTLRDKLLEEHWSYMDRYQAQMIARGPTFADNGDTPTGSVHIVSLPDPAAARAFAFDEPNYQAGVYRDVTVRPGRERSLPNRRVSQVRGTAALQRADYAVLRAWRWVAQDVHRGGQYRRRRCSVVA
jgi:uncharacterized protein YciI